MYRPGLAPAPLVLAQNAVFLVSTGVGRRSVSTGDVIRYLRLSLSHTSGATAVWWLDHTMRCIATSTATLPAPLVEAAAAIGQRVAGSSLVPASWSRSPLQLSSDARDFFRLATATRMEIVAIAATYPEQQVSHPKSRKPDFSGHPRIARAFQVTRVV